MEDKIKTLNKWISESKRIVFFGGAGVSTESGIPDFRSVDGLYSLKYDVPPETMLSRTYFNAHPEKFFRFYRDKMLCPDAMPNAAHRVLAALEEAGKLSAVITQNIDGLHQKAGSKNVLELHGSTLRNYCMRCSKFYSADDVTERMETSGNENPHGVAAGSNSGDKSATAAGDGIPRCECGGIIKPDVVLYEESLDERTLEASIRQIAEADMLIVGGTSLVVYPAAGLIRYYSGSRLVLINLSPTAYDSKANLVINERIGDVFGQIEI